jgi:chromate transporter
MQNRGSVWTVFLAFLKLGCTSFGGPIAHIGYFRDEFVARRCWLEDKAFADLVALCQFLPGPASSQVGFSIGLMRAGPRGGIAAWTGFTLPSAFLLVVFARIAARLQGPVGHGVIHGLKLVAVAIVAQAVLGMARTLCPDRQRASISAIAAVIVLWAPFSIAQVAAILAGAAIGYRFCPAKAVTTPTSTVLPISRSTSLLALGTFFLGLFILPLAQAYLRSPSLALFDAFYRSGALVFGGGHVVLPLLKHSFVEPGWIDEGAFLAGYGAAQAVPGPLFTFAAYLGAIAEPGPRGSAGAALGLAGIFLPGILILVGALPFWDALRARPYAQSMMNGVNAAVVGLLVAALYNPMWTGGVRTIADFCIVLASFVLLVSWRAPPVLVVLLSAIGATILEISA